MLNDSGIKKEMRLSIWAESALMATFYVNILVILKSRKLPQESKIGFKFKKLKNENIC
jgi:hypothetical protein